MNDDCLDWLMGFEVYAYFTYLPKCIFKMKINVQVCPGFT